MARKKQTMERGHKQTGCWFYELADGDRVYYCSFRKGGKNISAKVGKKSDGYTLEKCALHRGKLKMGEEKTRQQERIEEQAAKARIIKTLYDEYRADKNRESKDDSLFNLYVEPFYKKKDIQTCSNKDVKKHSGWLGKQPGRNGTGLSPQTMKHALALFRRVYRHAADKERLEIKISNFYMPVVRNTVTEQLDDEELRQYIHLLKTDKINRPVADAMLLALCTGMRQSEILGLRWTDVDWKKNIIKLRNTKNSKLKGFKKDEVTLEIPLNKDAKAILERQRKRSMIIFANAEGKQRRCISKQAARLRNKAGLGSDFRPFHALRHVYATKLHEQGVDIRIISKLLGHSSIAITERYVEVTDTRKQQAAEMMNVVNIGGDK